MHRRRFGESRNHSTELWNRHFFVNKAKGPILKQKSLTTWYVCVSRGKKFSFFEKFGVHFFLETPILRFTLFALLPSKWYFWFRKLANYLVSRWVFNGKLGDLFLCNLWIYTFNFEKIFLATGSFKSILWGAIWQLQLNLISVEGLLQWRLLYFVGKKSYSTMLHNKDSKSDVMIITTVRLQSDKLTFSA